jgi:hypothetical protein
MVGAVAAMLATTASATTLKKLTFREKAKEAEVGVLATVTGSETELVDGAVYTLTTFQVSDIAFGDAPQTITVRTEGGSRPGALIRVSETVAGSPTFISGSTNLLLLDETDGAYEVVGFNQGVFGAFDVDGSKRILFPEDKGGIVTVDEAFSILNDERSADEQIAQ